MNRKKLATETIEKEIRSMIKEEVVDAVAEEGISVDDIQSPEINKADVVIERLLAVFPSSEGYYGKLYRKTPSGKLEFKYHIDHLEEIEDPELEIANLIEEKAWKGGDYVLRIMKRGEPGIRRSITWNIARDEFGHEPRATPVENLQNMKEIITTVKEITGGNNENNTEVIADTFKAGMAAVKDMMPKTPQTPPVDAGEQLLKTITTLKELGIIKPDISQKDNGGMDIIKLITVLKELNPPQVQPQPSQEIDILAQIEKFQKLGLIKMPSMDSDDPFKQIEKIKTLATTFNLFGKSSDSPVIEAIKIIGPTIPKMVQNISETIQKVVDARMGMAGIKPNPVITNAGTVAPVLESETKKESNLMATLINELETAIRSNDKEYYPKLEDTINIYIGTHIIPGLVDGTIPVNAFIKEVQKIVPALPPYELTHSYLTGFIAAKQNEIVIKCSNPECPEEYIYTKGDDFSNDTCEVCNQPLTAVPVEVK